ncbi:LysR substrate-binding domain-containing protein [Azospirillum sp.]|uniref:LysR substrate-binding domain-containing protein n=1 Tax=Azospirillum sp. TaxID=34012 RepID=UPI002D622181|nr:LysR substrate-binding domain-containing protein [Azospirillum sp.]HYD66772.1 LysR substrate-binding domain-containing protein [Azospirillum sp.]
MRQLTFRQLRAFEVIARHGSFSRAAEELFLTQPALSIQMKKIADEVGLPLFDTSGRKVRLTEAGEALRVLAREVSDSVARFEQVVDDLKGLKRGRLRLAGVTTAEYFLPRLLGPFCAAYPGIDVELVVANREEVLERLRRGDDDLYVFGQPPDDMPVESAAFLENPLVVVAPDGHPLAGRPPGTSVSLAEVLEHPLLMREKGSGTRIAVERLLAEHGLRPHIRMELGSTEAIKQAVLGGLGLAVVSRHALATSVGLTELAVEGFPLLRHWYLVWPAGRRLSLAAGALIGHLSG